MTREWVVEYKQVSKILVNDEDIAKYREQFDRELGLEGNDEEDLPRIAEFAARQMKWANPEELKEKEIDTLTECIGIEEVKND